MGYRSMIDTLAQAALAFAGVNFGIAGTSLFLGLGLKHYRARNYSIDLPVYQDLPRGVY